MKFYLDNRNGLNNLESERDNLKLSKKNFLVSAIQEPEIETLRTNRLHYSKRIDIKDINARNIFLEERRAKAIQFIYEVDIDAENNLSASELAEEIKNHNGFLEVFPGVEYTDGNVSYANFNEVLIALNATTASERARFAVEHGLLLLDFDPLGNVGLYKTTQKVPEIFDKLSLDNRVKYAEPNYLGSVSDAEHAVLLSEIFPEFAFETYWAHRLTKIAEFENVSYGQDVVIAIIDSRIDKSHNDLRDSFAVDVEELDKCPGHVNLYMENHGTQAASVALSRKDVAPGRRLGVAPAAKLLPISVVLGSGDGFMSRAKALNVCAQIANTKGYTSTASGHRTAIPRLIVNCSWQVAQRPVPMLIEEAFKNLVLSDALVTCSSGNESRRSIPHYPSDYDGAISVAAVKNNDIVAKYSDINNKVNLCAPGGEVNVADKTGGMIAAVNGGGHAYTDGTSFAAPYAAGMAAALWSALPSLSGREIKDLFLRQSTVDILYCNPDLAGLLSAGRVDAERISLVVQHTTH